MDFALPQLAATEPVEMPLPPTLLPRVSVNGLAGALRKFAAAVAAADVDALLRVILDGTSEDVRGELHHIAVQLPDGTVAAASRSGDGGVSSAPGLEPDFAAGAGVRQRLCVPIRSSVVEYGELIALRRAGGEFTECEHELLAVHADCAASGLDAIVAVSEAKEAGERARSLLELSRVLAETAPTDEVALRLADAVRLVVDSDWVMVLTWEPADQALLLRASTRTTDSSPAEIGRMVTTALEADGLLGEMLAGVQDPVFFDREHGPEALRALTSESVAGSVIVPLLAVDGMVGLIGMSVVRGPERLAPTEDLLERLGAVASQASIALHNGRLVDDFSVHALHDALTGLANRLQFNETLRCAVDCARATGGEVALLFIDLDGFKEINDEWGHEVGDALLVAVGQRLRECTRSGDTVGRLGGDEFAVLIEHPAGLDRVSQRLAAAFERPFEVNGRELRVGASVGVARYPEDANSASSLIRFADTAMYQVKRTRHSAARAR